MSKKRKVTLILKYVADLLRQIHSLYNENENLSKKNDMLLQEVEKYKTLMASEKVTGNEQKTINVSKRKMIRFGNNVFRIFRKLN